MAVTPDLAWSLAGDDVVDFPEDHLPIPGSELAAGERYSWWLVWRRAVLLVVVAAALATGIVVVMHDWREWVPTATAPQSPTPDSATFLKAEAELPSTFYGPDVCGDIAAGNTVQQIVDAAQNSPLTLEQLRTEVTTAIKTYCPGISASAAHH